MNYRVGDRLKINLDGEWADGMVWSTDENRLAVAIDGSIYGYLITLDADGYSDLICPPF